MAEGRGEGKRRIPGRLVLGDHAGYGQPAAEMRCFRAMKLLLASALCAVLTVGAVARVGETMDNLKLRYGAPLGVEGEPESPTSRWRFQDRQYVIIVTIRMNRSVSEEFSRRDGRDFTLSEVREILEANEAPGPDWQQVSGRSWRQDNRVATWVDRTLLMQVEGLDE